MEYCYIQLCKPLNQKLFKMKKSLIVLVCFFFAVLVKAQSNKEDVALLQEMFGKDKKSLVSQYMTITDAQKDKFWALYDEYEDKRKALGRDRVKLIEDYANKYATLDDKTATDLTNRKLELVNKFTKLQQQYFSKFSTVIGGVQASKLMQLEDYLENNIRLFIQDQIPFIGELDKTKTAPKQ